MSDSRRTCKYYQPTSCIRSTAGEERFCWSAQLGVAEYANSDRESKKLGIWNILRRDDDDGQVDSDDSDGSTYRDIEARKAHYTRTTPTVTLYLSGGGGYDWSDLCANVEDIEAQVIVVNSYTHMESDGKTIKDVHDTRILHVVFLYKDRKSGKKRKLEFPFDLREGIDDEEVEDFKWRPLTQAFEKLQKKLAVSTNEKLDSQLHPMEEGDKGVVKSSVDKDSVIVNCNIVPAQDKAIGTGAFNPDLVSGPGEDTQYYNYYPEYDINAAEAETAAQKARLSRRFGPRC